MARPRKLLAAKGERPDLSEAMWEGARLERWEFVGSEFHFTLPPTRIAEKIGKTRQAVDKWRKNERYIQGVIWEAGQRSWEERKKPPRRVLTDPAQEGAKRDGMILTEGAWRDENTVRDEAFRERNLLRSRKRRQMPTPAKK